MNHNQISFLLLFPKNLEQTLSRTKNFHEVTSVSRGNLNELCIKRKQNNSKFNFGLVQVMMSHSHSLKEKQKIVYT